VNLMAVVTLAQVVDRLGDADSLPVEVRGVEVRPTVMAQKLASSR
jgi:hypothetical protein